VAGANEAPENYFGISDPAELEVLAGESTARRLGELENSDPLTSFTREDLVGVHSYLMQDVYPWAGQIRTTEVGAMGMAMCRAQFVDNELDRVFSDIERKPPSTTDMDAAVSTVADHWSELTMVHPFQDGNSRTQRLFFDQMLRNAGWGLDWTQINADQVHAARYVGAATVDPRFLADTLRPAVHPADKVASGSLTASEGTRDDRTSAAIFHDMMDYRRAHPGQPYQQARTVDDKAEESTQARVQRLWHSLSSDTFAPKPPRPEGGPSPSHGRPSGPDPSPGGPGF
jgi:cell filamentation protein